VEDILLSQKQYKALLERLDGITNDVTIIKLKTGAETAFVDNFNLQKLLGVSARTIQRWRKEGILPYVQFGKKLYYRADFILDRFKIKPDAVDTLVIENNNLTQPEMPDSFEDDDPNVCKRCPLFLVFQQ